MRREIEEEKLKQLKLKELKELAEILNKLPKMETWEYFLFVFSLGVLYQLKWYILLVLTLIIFLVDLFYPDDVVRARMEIKKRIYTLARELNLRW